MLPHGLQVLGHVARTHGVQGQVLVKVSSHYELTTDEPVFVDLQGPVPFFISTIKRGSGGFIIQFEWIETMEKAEELVGKEILVKAIAETEGGEQFPILGFTVHDIATGRSGVVVDVQPMNHHPILIVEIEDKEVMIPFVENLIVEINDQNRSMKMDLPEGLLDI